MKKVYEINYTDYEMVEDLIYSELFEFGEHFMFELVEDYLHEKNVLKPYQTDIIKLSNKGLYKYVDERMELYKQHIDKSDLFVLLNESNHKFVESFYYKAHDIFMEDLNNMINEFDLKGIHFLLDDVVVGWQRSKPAEGQTINFDSAEEFLKHFNIDNNIHIVLYENGKMEVSYSHHDGTNYYEFKAISDKMFKR